MFTPNPITLNHLINVPNHSDFIFIIDGKKYYCNEEIIYITSPFLSKKLQKQETTYEFKNLKDPFNYFPLFLQILKGIQVEINEDNYSFIGKIAYQLEIQSLIDVVDEFNSKVQLDLDTSIKIIKHEAAECIESLDCAELIAKEWVQFQKAPDALDLPLYAYEQIFSSESFRNQHLSSSELSNWIKNLIVHRKDSDGHSLSPLFQFVDFRQLSPSEISEIISLISYDFIPKELSENIKSRLYTIISNISPTPNFLSPEPLDFDGDTFGHVLLESPTSTAPSSIPKEFKISMGIVEFPQTIPLDQNPPETKDFSEQIPPSPQIPNSDYVELVELKIPFHPDPSDYEAEVVENISEASDQFEMLKKLNAKLRADPDDIDPNFDGVISKFQEIGTNEMWKNFVELRCNIKQKLIYNIFNYQGIEKSYWDNYDIDKKCCSINTAFFTIFFPYHLIKLSSYKISVSTYNTQIRPKSWKIEGSNDGQKWILIDSKSGSNCLKNPYKGFPIVYNFQILSHNISAFQFFRFTQLENFATSPQFKNELSISSFELYGDINPK